LSFQFEISERRLMNLSAIIAALLTTGSLAISDWRVTAGVFLGGLLSLLNFYWLKLSLSGLLNRAAQTGQPRFNAALYVLRYIFIALVVAVAASFGFVSVAATFVGLLSFAFAIFIEIIIQLIFVFINREDI
jgi:hypothetical protein